MGYFATEYDVVRPAVSLCAVLEDSIMHRGRPVTAGSKMLENFVSPLDATVVTRLEAAGFTILGKTKMDEFGVAGLFSETTGVSGAVSAIAGGVAALALCNDYTGAVSALAAAHGLFYIRPTYGTVSRFGLIPAVPSMDQIGILCKTPEEGFRALAVIAGFDPKDGAMFGAAEPRNAECGMRNAEYAFRLGLFGMRDTEFLDEFRDRGFDAGDIGLEYFDFYGPVMQILCCAELSACLSRYDGVKFGYRAENFSGLSELYIKSRTEAFGQDVKLAAVMGAMVLSQDNYMRYYDKAMRVRRLIKQSLYFDEYDAIITPAPCALPQLAGLPAVTMPYRGNVITLITNTMREDTLLSLVQNLVSNSP